MAKMKLSADKRREIVELLQSLLTKSAKPDMWKYPDDWSDAKVATDMGVTTATVIGIRSSLFGKLDSIGYIPVGQMAKRIVALEEQLLALQAMVTQLQRAERQNYMAPRVEIRAA